MATSLFLRTGGKTLLEFSGGKAILGYAPVAAITGVALSSTSVLTGIAVGASLGPYLIASGTGLNGVALTYAIVPGQDADGEISVSSSGGLIQGPTAMTAGSKTFEVTVTPAGGLVCTATLSLTASATGTFSQPLAIHNGATWAMSSPQISLNHQFAKSDIPNGAYPQIFKGETALTTQVDQVRTWSNGSLSGAALSVAVADSFDAHGGTAPTVAYTIKSTVGAPSNTPAITLATIASAGINVHFDGLEADALKVGVDTIYVDLGEVLNNAAPGVHRGTLTAIGSGGGIGGVVPPNLTIQTTAVFDDSGKFTGELASGHATLASSEIPAGANYTIECWARCASAPASGNYSLFQRDGDYSVNVDSTGRLSLATNNGSGTTSTNVCDGAFHHIALVVGSSAASLYIDGNLGYVVSGGPGSTASNLFLNADATIEAGSPGGFGAICEFALWNSVRYNTSFTPPAAAYTGHETGLVGCWPLATNGVPLNPNVGIAVGTITLDSLTSTIAMSDGTTQPFTVTKGMQVAIGSSPVGDGGTSTGYITAVSGNTITLSQPLLQSVTRGQAITFSYPTWGYTIHKQGPVCTEIEWWSYLQRGSDGAFHYWIRAGAISKFWANGSHEHSVMVTNPNMAGRHLSGSMGLLPALQGMVGLGGWGSDPTCVFTVGSVTLYQGNTMLAAWGGVNDSRSYTFTTSSAIFAPTGEVSLPTPPNGDNLGGVPVVFSAAGGTLPTGLPVGVPLYQLGMTDQTSGVTGTFLGYSRVNIAVINSQSSIADWAANTSFQNEAVVRPAGSTGFYVQESGAAATSGSTAPAGNFPNPVINGVFSLSTGGITDGGCYWHSLSPEFTDAGSGTIRVSPAVAIYPQCGFIGRTNTGQPVYVQGSSSQATRPNMLPVPDFTYLSQKTKAIPPYDQNITPGARSSLIQSDRGLNGSYVTFSPGSYPIWGNDISAYGDDPGDERVGFLNSAAVWLLYLPTDVMNEQFCNTSALANADLQIFIYDESTGFPLVINQGPNRTGTPYPGLGGGTLDGLILPGEDGGGTIAGSFYYSTGRGWGTCNLDRHSDPGYYSQYGGIQSIDAAHNPNTPYVPYLRSGDPLWLNLSINLNNALIGRQPQGARNYLDGSRVYATSGIHNPDQVRGAAWLMKISGQAEWMTPDAHPMRGYQRDVMDDNAGYLASSGVTRAGPEYQFSGAFPGGINDTGNTHYYTVYHGWFVHCIVCWEAAKENDNARRPGWTSYIQSYGCKSLSDPYDTANGGYASDYFAGTSQNFIVTDPNNGVLLTTLDQAIQTSFNTAGMGITSPSMIPATNMGINSSTWGGNAFTPNYPFDTTFIATIWMSALSMADWAGLTWGGESGKPRSVWTRGHTRITTAPLVGITWGANGTNQHYDNNFVQWYLPWALAPIGLHW